MAENHASAKRSVDEATVKELSSKRPCYDYDNTITVLVGKGEQRFTVHKDIICVKSKFFRAACSDRWREGQEKVVRLPEARSTRAFQMYMDWTYSNEVLVNRVDLAAPLSLWNKLADDLLELYLLGDILDDVKLRNKTLRLLNTDIRCLDPTQCRLIWDHTSPSAPIREWSVDAFVSSIEPKILLSLPECMKMCHEILPAEFLLRAALNAMGRIDKAKTGVEPIQQRMDNYMEPDGDSQ